MACAAAEVVAELGAIADPGIRVREALARAERCLDAARDPDLWPGDLGALALGRSGAALTTDACVTYAETLERLRAAAAARIAGPYRDLLDGLLAGYGERYAAAKRALSGLDFEDLELECRALLRDDDELRERYRRRFAAIMVDEFQDTNRIQLELIESIASGNLFTVGDAQQSIYGFRHADVALFRDRSARLQVTGGRETLQTNFRTRPQIIDVLNPGFAEAMGERLHPAAGRARVRSRPRLRRPVGRGDPRRQGRRMGVGGDGGALAAGRGTGAGRAGGRPGGRRGVPGRDRRADARHHRHARLRARAGAARACRPT